MQLQMNNYSRLQFKTVTFKIYAQNTLMTFKPCLSKIIIHIINLMKFELFVLLLTYFSKEQLD